MTITLCPNVRQRFQRSGELFQAGFASLFILQQNLQILSYDTMTPNSVFRRLQLRVTGVLLVLEMELAYWFYEGNLGQKRIKYADQKPLNSDTHYRLELRRIYSADVGHNTIEFDHMHLTARTDYRAFDRRTRRANAERFAEHRSGKTQQLCC